MSRSQMCTKRPAPGQGVLIHCDHNGKCCWCGETKEPEHGPYAPAPVLWPDGLGGSSLGGTGWPYQISPMPFNPMAYPYPVSPSVPPPFQPNVIYCGNDPNKLNACGGL